MSGPDLGRRPTNVSKDKKKQTKEDEKIRQAIEGKFGQAKRSFNLDRVMAKLDRTSQTAIPYGIASLHGITFLVMNLVAGFRKLLWLFLCQFLSIITGDHRQINNSYLTACEQQQ
jgi:transposase, IS5 family